MAKSKARTKKKKSGTPKKKAKSARKKSVKKTAPKKKTGGSKASKAKKAPAPAQAKKAPRIPGKLVGAVTHYFPHVNAAVIKIESGELRVGDSLYFKGHTTNFKQVLNSIQINHVAIERATVGDDIGVGVKDRVREGDRVYKLK